MFRHVKQLQYTVRVSEPNPGLANLLWNSLAARRANWRPPAATSRKV
ncbi:manganese catalase family protein [Salmonella enterica]|nr:manganese catalase family protein [Salmonella enterica]